MATDKDGIKMSNRGDEQEETKRNKQNKYRVDSSARYKAVMRMVATANERTQRARRRQM